MTRTPAEPASDTLRRAPAAVHQVIQTSGQPLENRARQWMESRFLHSFGHVRVHADTAAAASARQLDAAAYSVGEHVVFGRGQYAPQSPATWPLIAHELSHTAQSPRAPTGRDQSLSIADPATRHESAARETASLAFGNSRVSLAPPPPTLAVQRATADLASVPEGERLIIKVSAAAVAIPDEEVKDVFATTGDRTTYNPLDGETVFGPGIDRKLQRGLTSVGGYLISLTNVLPLNATIDVALDLRPHGGANAVYRFTWFKHTEAKKSGDILLVELVGPAVAARVVATVPGDTFTVSGQSFNLAGTWAADEFTQLQQAIGLLPAPALTEATGLTFHRTSGHGPGTEAGHYDPTSDTVVLYDNAFKSDVSARMGGVPPSEHNILHEVGHGIDLRVTERAWRTFNTGGQTAAGRTTFLAVRSPSGSRYIQPGGGDYKADLNLGLPQQGVFRTAVTADKVKPDTSKRKLLSGGTANLSGGITDYADTDFQELFAESYAQFVLDPEKLRVLRPHTYAFFKARYAAAP
jgi:Domain of unknown function (DUF4157)